EDETRGAAAADRRLRASFAMKLRRLSTAARGFDAKLNALTRYEASADAKVQKTVARILADVRARGDAAVLANAKRFDKSTTRSIPRVDKIVGPGNAYVAEAKRQVFGGVGIDMIAGPSEILVLSDGTAPADWLAMDLFSQAEHDEDAQALLLSPDCAHLDAVEKAMARLLGEMPRKRVIGASLKARGALIHTRDLEEACALANRIAPEHLELCVAEPEAWLP